MRILSIRRLDGPAALARVDVELTEHVRLYSLLLKKNADGKVRIHSPHSCGKNVATFHPIIAQEITEAAIAALEATAYDHHR
ncbi:hypothetical protein [Phyllobacterium zundukense]|uniref:Uncharacterized protein n=1 Tax=Phyllobacterium zundukense TaxID=1867719 RepID=A0ACD4D6Z5_9HYPH|nr:hypothetical protein [Phyllobacterium zundukense]UXN61577.1 hypothetical protein N8E88_16080 [Phyllobacterium zundukense]